MNVFPAKITYADTPVLPIAAFTGSTTGQVDCEFSAGTPRIKQVDGVGGGPFASTPGETVTIQSVGTILIANPDFDSTQPVSVTNPRTVPRDFGFGTTQGQVNLIVGGVSTPLTVNSWSDASIQVEAPGVGSGQLMVTRGDNLLSTVVGVTLTVGGSTPIVRVPAGGSIQSAIDTAVAGSLILVAPGRYAENLILHKNVVLQGAGEGSTLINGFGFISEIEELWLAKINALVAGGQVSLVPGQRTDFFQERGAALTVLGNASTFTGPPNNARIDGFTITGSQRGGGIFVNGYAHYLQISNNRITANSGNFGGGIRLGWQSLVNATNDGYNSAANDHISIIYNHIKQNGSQDNGGGVAIYNGADQYNVSSNYICGNFSAMSGGGVAHFGLSDQGVIKGNKILLQEVFKDLNIGGFGGGLFISGEAPPAAAPLGTLTPGTGTVTVDANLIPGQPGIQ